MRTPSYDAAAAWTQENDITENDPSTQEEEWEAQRILSLPESLQQFAVDHKQDQFDAMPAYTNRYKR